MRKIFTSCSTGINMPVNYKKSVIAFLVVLCVLLFATAGFTQPYTTPAVYAGTGTDVTGVGTVTWSNPGNVLSDDNNYATVALSNSTSHYLQATNYGFAIPTNATITGVTVSIGRFENATGNGNDVRDNVVRLITGGTVVGNNLAATTTEWPTSEGVATYGATTNLWGLTTATLTPAIINASNFGVALAANSTNSRTASVDYIKIAITYTGGTYSSSVTSINAGSSTWCAGETRTVSVTIKNTGTFAWTDGTRGTPDFNIGVKWNLNGANWTDYYIRVDAGNLAAGATGTYSLPITASNNIGAGYTTPLAAGNNNLTFNVVYEGVMWFSTTSANTSSAQTIVAIPSTPTGSTTQPFCAINNPTVANLTATPSGGNTIKWYTAATGSATLASTDPLTTGTYYASQITSSGCESPGRLAVAVTVSDPAPPTGATQNFCAINNPTVGSLSAAGSTIKWYTAAIAGALLPANTVLTTGTHYYASQTVGSCESSTRLDVTAVIDDSPAPTGSQNQSFCAINNPTVTDLVATGTAIKWYATATGGTALATSTPLASGHYYASQTAGSCESSARLDVTVTVSNPPAPSGNAFQSFCVDANPTIGDLAATGTSIQWYDAATGGNLQTASTPLVNGTHYYASQTVGGCESATRLNVTAIVNDNGTINLSSAVGTDNQTICAGIPIANITYSIGGFGTTGATVSGLPAGITGVYNSGTFTISGASLAIGTYNYTVTTTGPCTNNSLSGAITVTTSGTVARTSATGTDAQTVCINNLIADITYAIGGDASGASITAGSLPAGVSGTYDNSTGIFTISGIATGAGTFNYTITASGSSCANLSASGTITVNDDATIVLSSVAGTDNQITCINTAITNIDYTIGGGGTGVTLTGTLPAGVTGSYNTTTKIYTISGTPTASGTFSYTVTTTGPCIKPALSGTIIVTPNATISRTSATGTDAQTICINNAINNITYSIGGSGTGASITAGALPAGVTGTFSAGVFTISGTPTVSGTFNYTITTTGPCVNPAASGSIIVNADATISLSSAVGTDNQTKCISTAITSITYLIGGSGAGVTLTGTLPAGVTGNYNTTTKIYTISGTPTASGTFSYTVTTTGPCIKPALSGTIIVTPNATISRTSATGTDAQTICINNAINNITYSIGGSGTGASITAGALPAGVTGTFSAGVFTISGTPTASGSFPFTVTAAGPCASASLSGTLIVNADATISLSSAAGTDNQTKCISTAITSITYLIGGSGAGVTLTGTLPAGVTGSYNTTTKVYTISGTPTASGTFSYTVTTTGPCIKPTLSGTIIVQANSTITRTSASSTTNQTVCINNAITNITYTIGGGGTGTTVTGLPTGITGNYSGGVFTISGTPTVPGTFNYNVTTTGPCTNPSSGGTITVNADATISLSSAVGTDNQTKCINNAITSITYLIGGSGAGVTLTGTLPAGVTGSYNTTTKIYTISGTPTASGTFSYTVTTTGPCIKPALSGTIIVTPNATISRTSATGTDAQTICINNAINNITYSIGGSGTGASITAGALPAGVTGTFSAGVFTISGTPTVSGTFNYTITTTGPCVNPAASGSIIVNADATISLSSAVGTDNQTKCISTAITSITYLIGGSGAGVTLTGTLPAGVTGNYNTTTKIYTISGTPTASGTFSYTVTTTGPCIKPALSGTIIVTPNATISRTSATGTDAQTICINNAINNITYSIGGSGTGASITAGALPAGVTGTFSAGVFTISGTPTVSGTFNYTITTTGPCVNPAASGSIIVNADATISLSSAVGTDNQTKCISTAITSITYLVGGGGAGVTLTGTLPAGVTGSYNAGTKVYTISGTPTASGTFSYMVTTTGPCIKPALSGTITINPLPTATISGTTIVCQNNSQPNITFAGANGTAPYTFTYKIDAGGPQTVTTVSGNSVDVSVPTSTTGVYNYTLLSVQDASSTTCSNTVSGQVATVTVKEPVVITTQPQSETTCASFPVSFSVTATGDDLTYQWYHNGNPVSLTDPNISGSQAATLNIDQAGTGDIGTYYVIVSGSSACGDKQSDNVTLAVNQSIVINTQPVAQAVCTGGTATFTISATGTGINYQWSKGTVPLSDGVQPGGSSISGSNSATLTIAGVSASDAAANYNVVMTTLGGGCPQLNSANRKLVVNPVPAVDPVTDKNICAGTASSAISFSGGVTGTVYNWTNSNPSIGLAASGSSGTKIPSFTASNTGTAPVTATIIVTPTFTNAGTPATTCSGAPITFTITVNPTATITAISNQVLCNGSSTTAVNFGSTATGGSIVYNWTNDKPSIGLAASGLGDINSFTAVNPGTVPVTATIKIKASYTNATTTCTGPEQSFTITVNPTPVLSSILTAPGICSNSAFSYNPTSATTGVTFNWSRATIAGISNAPATGTGNPNEILVNTSANPVTVTYVYTLTANGCSNMQNVTVVVKPTPALTSSLTPPSVCSNSPFTYVATSATSLATFSWSRAAVAGISNTAAAGIGNINETLINTTGNPVNVTYVYTLTANGCSNMQNVVVTVNPIVKITPSRQEICSGSLITPITITPPPNGTITSWSSNINPANISSTVSSDGTGLKGTLTNSTTNSISVIFTITASTGTCATTTTDTVIVDAPITGPVVIGDGQVVCGNPAPLTIKTPPTGGGPLNNYVWQQSTTGSGGWTTATGSSNSPIYTPPQVNMWYRLITNNGCGSLTSNSVQIVTQNDFNGNLTVTPNPMPTVLCSGDSINYTITSGSLTGFFGSIEYTWKSVDPGYFTAPAPNPFGDRYALIFFRGEKTFTVHNPTNAPLTKTLTITPTASSFLGTCNMDALVYNITINPVPVIAPATTATCSGTAFTYTPQNGSGNIVPASTNYTWGTPTGSGFTGGTGGSGSAITGTLTNTTAAPVTATYSITPTYTGSPAPSCPGNPFTLTVTINPTPVVPTQNYAACSNTAFSFAPSTNLPSTIVPAGTTYTWTVVSVPSGVSGASNQSTPQNFVNQTLQNSTDAPLIVVYAVTPTAGSCPGTPFTLNVTVNPTATAAIITPPTTVCYNTGTTITFSGTANTVVSFTIGGDPTVHTVTLDGTGTGTYSTGLLTAATTYTLQSVVFPSTPSCSQALSGSVTVSVNPVATATISAGASPICSGQSSTIIFTGTPSAIVTYNDGTVNQTVTLNAGGTATVTVSPTTTTTYTLISVEYPGTPNCLNGLSGSATITVSPNANAGTITGMSPLCINATATYTSNGDAGGSWSSSNTSIAAVDPVTGVVTAKAAGTVNITYTVNSGCNNPVSASQQLIVNPNANAGIITGGTGAPICVGSHVGFSSTGDAGGTWTTSDGTVATVSTSGVVTAIGTGTATITYTVNSGCNPPSSSSKTVQVVNAGALLDPGTISGPSGTLCANTQFVFSVPAVDDATFYVWTLPPGWTASGSTTTPTNSITVTTNAGGTGTITVTAGNACGFSPSSSTLVVTVSSVHIWVGITSADWNNPSNWCGGVPTAATDVLIPATGPVNYNLPVLSTNAQAHDITMPAGANIDLNGYNLTVNGAFAGTGTLSGSAASGLSVTGAAGTVYFKQAASNKQLKTLTVNAGGSLKLGDTLNIAPGNSGTGYGTVSVNGNLDANGVLILKSDANGTAMVGQSNGTISGNVTVERFIPPLRAWRFMAVPYSSSGQTVWEAWQEGANNYGIDYATFNKNPHPGYGTHITGNNSSDLGYDFNTTVNPSYKVWDPAANTWRAAEPPTISTQITSFNGAYCIFIRGSRAVNLSMGTSAPTDPTVLRSTGILNQTGPVATKTYSGGAGKFVMIGNPYASTINILDIVNRSSGIENDRFWVWDPKIVGAGTDNVGAYVSYKGGVLAPPNPPSFLNGINDAKLVQSSQAFMVQLSAGSSAAVMDFRETDKLTQSVGVFGLKAAKSSNTSDPVIYTNLMLRKGKDMMLVDGVAAGFNKRFKAAADDEDAAKLWNFDENISLVRDGKPLAIEFRPAINKKDTLFYDLRLKQKSYTLKVFAANIGTGSPLQAWLIDKYLGKQTLINLNDTSYYSFTPARDTAKDRNRFILVFTNGKDVKPKAESIVNTASVYPNPVSGNSFNLVLQDFNKGDYKVNIYNSNGNLIITRSIHYEGSKNAFNFKLPVNVIAGNYTLKVVNYSGDVLSTIPVLVSK